MEPVGEQKNDSVQSDLTESNGVVTQTAITPKRRLFRPLVTLLLVGGVALVLLLISIPSLLGTDLTKEPTLSPAEEDMVWRPHKDFAGLATTSSTSVSVDAIEPVLVTGAKRPLHEVREATNIRPYDAVVSWLPEPRQVSRDTVPVQLDEYFSKVLYVGKVTDNGALSNMVMYVIYEEGMGRFPSLYAISS